MAEINLLAIQRVSAADKERIQAVDPRVRLTDAGGWFDGEIRETWPAFTAERYLAAGADGQGTRGQRDALLAEAEVILGGWPFPLDLRSRTPKLKWFHQRPAGASNLLRGDLWGSDVTVTTSRGAGNTSAMTEFTIAGILYFAKGLNQAALDLEAGRFDFRAYRPLSLPGKTLCVVGAGGIGRDLGRIASALGLLVVGTRRSPDGELPEGFAELGGPGDLDRYLGMSDFVAVCCQWTPETTHLFNAERFALMKQGAILANVARGEIVDEPALVQALDSGQLRGAVLDVYDGEFEHSPLEALWRHPRALVTPHISAQGDADRHRAVEVFLENLAAYVSARPLQNVIDWDRGY